MCMIERQKKVKSILISQPEPENGKSPYIDLAKKHNLKVDYRSFVQVDELDPNDFRQQKISILNHNAVIFTSKNAMDHYFLMCEKLRLMIPETTKYFCVSEAISGYLQNYITFRKRKVITGGNTFKDLLPQLKKHNECKFLLPSSDVLRDNMVESLESIKLDFTKAMMYKVGCSDLSDLKDVYYDILVFFSPTGITSLFKNFPDFVQNNTRIAAFGSTTAQAVLDKNLILDIEAPSKDTPSMATALDKYITASNKKRKKT